MCQDKFYFELLDFAEKRLKTMDELGIEKSVISLALASTICPPPRAFPPARRPTRPLYKVTQQFPGRFLGSAILPILDVEAAVKELEHCVKDYGFVMWQTHSNYGPNIDPDNEQFRPVWRKVAELGIFAYLHPHCVPPAQVQPVRLRHGCSRPGLHHRHHGQHYPHDPLRHL